MSQKESIELKGIVKFKWQIKNIDLLQLQRCRLPKMLMNILSTQPCLNLSAPQNSTWPLKWLTLPSVFLQCSLSATSVQHDSMGMSLCWKCFSCSCPETVGSQCSQWQWSGDMNMILWLIFWFWAQLLLLYKLLVMLLHSKRKQKLNSLFFHYELMSEFISCVANNCRVLSTCAHLWIIHIKMLKISTASL